MPTVGWRGSTLHWVATSSISAAGGGGATGRSLEIFGDFELSWVHRQSPTGALLLPLAGIIVVVDGRSVVLI